MHRLKYRVLAGIGIIWKQQIAVLAWLLAGVCCVHGEGYPNVLIILADDLGYGDLGCYGATKVETPNIDRLAQEGRLFSDAHSPSSVCTPSRYNLLTGRYAWRTWVGGSTVWANDPLLIDPDRFTLADLFKEQGYTTACIGKWHLGFGLPGMEGWDDILGPDYNGELKPGPLELGFDYFWGFPHVGQLPHFIIENHRVLGLEKSDPVRITPDKRPGFELDYLNRPRSGLAAALGVEGGANAMYEHEELCNMLTSRAVGWLNTVPRDKPWFLYMAHRNIHGPLIPDPRFVGKSEIGKRGDFLMEFDESVGRVLDTLERNGMRDDTLVIFASDNGGIFQYRPIDYPEDHGHRLNGPLRGQKTTVYEGGHRVPMLARWPGVIPAGSRNNAMIALTDLLATFADFFGKPLPANAGEDSFSFLGPLLEQADRQPRRTAMVNDSYRELLSIRKGPWKYIDGQGGGGARAPEQVNKDLPPGQLYHLGQDIAEKNNLFKNHPGKVRELKSLLGKYQREGRSAPVNRQPNFLVLAIDDLNDYVGCLGGHPNAATPNLDRLAGMGVLFTRAYCNAPVCNPSRASIWTGLRPTTTGIVSNRSGWFRARPGFGQIRTLPQAMQDNGYITAGFGKLFHLGSQNGVAGEWMRVNTFNYGPRQDPKLNYNMGDRVTDWGVPDGNNERAASYDPDIADRVIDFLEDQQAGPFFLGCGFFRPHTPLYAAQRWFDSHSLEDIVLPVTIPNDLDDLVYFGKRERREQDIEAPGLFKQDWVEDNGKWKELIQAYLASTSAMDFQLGRVLDALESDNALLENTYIICFSDHGWHLGEKRHWGKAALWEQTTRVPFIIAGPGIPRGQQCDQPVDLLNIFPTVLDYARMESPHELDGHSLRELLEDPRKAWPHPVLTTFVDHHSLRTARWRYIRYASGEEELYDHACDPEEFDNLAVTRAYDPVVGEVLVDMRQQLAVLLQPGLN